MPHYFAFAYDTVVFINVKTQQVSQIKNGRSNGDINYILEIFFSVFNANLLELLEFFSVLQRAKNTYKPNKTSALVTEHRIYVYKRL